MMEIASIEAVRAAQAPQSVQFLDDRLNARQVADSEAVAAFEEAMSPQATDPVPFASQVSEAWRYAQDTRQAHLRKIEAIVNENAEAGRSMRQMLLLQYEMINFGFQQEVVSDVAKKVSGAIETLVKNG